MASRRFLLLCAILVSLISLPLCQVLSNMIENPGEPSPAPLTQLPNSRRISGVYVVQFHDNYTIDEHWRTIGRDLSSYPGFKNFHLFSAYTAKLNAEGLDLVRRDPGVKSVETNARVTVSLGDRNLTPTQRDTWDLEDTIRKLYTRADNDNDDDDNNDDNDNDNDLDPMICDDTPPQGFTTLTQKKAPWHLDVIGALDKLPQPVPQGTYRYIEGGGKGVDVYVLDTGVNIGHKYFRGRATNFGGRSPVEASPYLQPSEPMYDTNNHGTLVAGLVGADHVGVARAANIINVKVLSKSDSGSGNSAEFEFAYMLSAWHDMIMAHKRKCQVSNGEDMSFRGSIILASFEYRLTPESIDDEDTVLLVGLVGIARSHGMQVVAAAGNQDPADNPHFVWPCFSHFATCVAPINKDYSGVAGSFYGWGVDVLAPGGKFVLSTSWAGARVLGEFNGSEAAAPIVAGVAAIFVSWKGLAGGDVRPYLQENALQGVCSDLPNAQPNRLVNTGILSPAKAENEPFVGGSSTAAPQNAACPGDEGLMEGSGGPRAN